MAFALTKYKSYGIRYDGAVRPHGKQVVEMVITAANTDTAYDLGTTGGTFWTACEANATYGSLASAAKYNLLTSIAGIIDQPFKPALTGDNIAFYQGAAASGVVYTLVNSTALVPELAFASGSAPTAITLILEFLINDGAEPVYCDYGTSVT